MNENGPIVLYGSGDKRYAEIIRRYAATYGRELKVFGRDQSMFNLAPHFKTAGFVWIWNGCQFQTPLAARLCRRRGIPYAFYENGLLPQSGSFLIDLAGFCGDSMLNGPLHWVTDEDRERLRKTREELQSEHTLRDDGHVLVPFQVECDTQILYHTDVVDMNDLVDRVKLMYPRGRIVFRSHPKSGYRGERPFDQRCELDSRAHFLASAARASVVVGLTSTCLYEAAILGKPVVALGDHPLRCAPNRVEDVLAGVLALRVDRETGNPADVLERFNLRPIGAKPCS